jgi:hypothetical protein
MSSLLLRMLLPLTLLAATGVPSDPACASVRTGTATSASAGGCGRGDGHEIPKLAKDSSILAPGKAVHPTRVERE